MCVGHFAFHIWPPWLICKNIIFFYHYKLFPSMVIIIQYCKWRFHHEKVCILTNTSCISTKSVTRLAEWLISSEYNECSSVCIPSILWNRFLPWRDNLIKNKSRAMACHKKIRYNVTLANAGSNSLELLPANNTRLVMEEMIMYNNNSHPCLLPHQTLLRTKKNIVSRYPTDPKSILPTLNIFLQEEKKKEKKSNIAISGKKIYLKFTCPVNDVILCELGWFLPKYS